MEASRAKDLDQNERDIFIKKFYELWNKRFEFIGNDASKNAVPWGMPWHCGQDVFLTGDTPEEMAKNFFNAKLKD